MKKRKESKNSMMRALSRAFSRHDFSSWSYAAWFCLINLFAIVILQWGINDTNAVSNSFAFVGKIFLGKFEVVNEFLLTGLVYFIVIMLVNRFWLATQIFLDICIFITVVERFKLESRSETILPSDLGFVTGGKARSLAGWMPDDALWIIVGAVILAMISTAFFLIIGHRDTRKSVVRSRKLLVRSVKRVVAAVVAFSFLFAFVMSMASVGSWSNSMLTFFGDSPKLWDSKIDAQNNGTAVGFARLLNPKVMDKPAGYSEKTMKQIASRYAHNAQELNVHRSARLKDSTVIYILSESFSDPSRVPGLKVSKDVMPFVRELKSKTTSGLMLSSGYGGGTANLEYMALTGLSMSNFAPSLSSPYQQLVPTQKWSASVNQLWGEQASLAFHPYQSNMYSRNMVYKRFGFSQFSTLDGPLFISPTTKLGTSPYVSDKSTYTSILNSLEKVDQSPHFYQVVTMQNHMPYKNYYANNEIKAESTTGTPLEDSEKSSIETYAKGMEYTDGCTKEFLEQLDKLNRPITVVFYGDHLPGVYKSAAKDDNNSVALHETDYFIWSNKASGVDNAQAAEKATNSAYTSPNFFTAQLAEHLNAKVSPYIAFLTALHAKVPAMEPPVVNKIQGWSRIPDGQALYLDNEGNYLDVSQADAQTKQLLEDYKFVQYDFTAGKNYLKNTDFMNIS